MSIRYKIFAFLLLASVRAWAQNPPLPVPRSSPAIVATDSRLDARLNLKIPVVVDTTAALNGGLDSLGLIIQVRGTGSQYKRDTFPGGHKWTLIGSGSIDTTSISNRINGKRDILDTAYAHLLMTRAWGYKMQDSMKIVNDGRYIQNFLNVPFLGYGPHSSHPTTGTGIYYDTDSAAWFYYSSGTGTNLTGVFNVYFRAKGGPGDTAYVFGRGSNIYVAAMRDSTGSCIHHIINPDSSWTWYSTCTVGAPQDSSWLNMQWFAGVPDGVHDNSSGLQAGWNYAAAHNKNVYMPPGTYIDSVGLVAPTSGSLSVSWNFAPGASIIYPNKTGQAFLYTGAAFHDILFINPQINGVHDTTNVGPAGILMQGLTQSQRIKRVAIIGGVIKGFVSCFSGKGIDDLEMDGVHYLADHGHDDGTTTTVPNVMVRAQVDSFGDMNKRWNIHDCYFDGYSGSAAITTLKTGATMDGAFYGPVSGLIFHHNQIWRMGEEAVVYQPGLAVIDSAVSVIDDNSIYGTVPAGAKEINGVKNHHAIGISAVGQHIRVLNNHLYGVTHGIESIAFGLWNAAFTDVVISGNDMTLSKDTALYPNAGIYDQAYAGTPSKYHKIFNNHLLGDSATLTANFPFISVINVDSPMLAANDMTISGRTNKAGHTVTGIALNTVTGALIGDNPMIGVDARQSNTSATFSNSVVGNAGGANSIQTGILSARPAASNCACFYASTTDSTLYYDPPLPAAAAWEPLQKASTGGGAGTPAGSNKNVQINNVGGFGFVPNFNADPTSHVVSMDTVTALKGNMGGSRIPVGTIFSDKFNRLTLGANYTQTLPVGSVTLDGTKMHITGGVGNSSNYITYGYNITSEQWTYSVSGKMDSVTSTSYGIILGMQGTSHGINAIFQMSSGTGQVILESTLGTPLATSSGAVSLNANDSFYISLSRSHDSITGTFIDPTSATSATVLFKYVYTAGGSSDIVQTAQPRLYLFGGPQDISSLSFTENMQHNIPVIGLGNSIMQGINAGAITNRYMNVLFSSNYSKFAVFAGPSNLIQDIRNSESEIAALAPKIALVEIGTNDFGAGTSVANWSVLYGGLADELIGMNIKPVLLFLTPRNGGDVRPYDTAVMNIANARGLQYIDIYTPLKASGGSGLNPTYDPGDGLHFNSAGHALVASTILAAAPYLLTIDSAYSFMANQQKVYINTGASFGDRVNLGSHATVDNNLPLDDSTDAAINSKYLKFYMKNGAPFVINGTSIQTGNYNLLGQGTALQFSSQGSNTLTAANATFFNASPILSPTANGQTTSAIVINPNFVNTFSATNYAVRILNGDIQFANGTFFNILDATHSRTLNSFEHVWQNNFSSATTGALYEFKNQANNGLTGDVVLIDAVATAGTGGSMLHLKGNSNAEVIKALANGNTLIGTATDNAAFLQVAANTTANAAMFLNGSAADVTSPTQGMLRYITTGTHHLYFRDNGADVDLLTSGGGTNYQTVQSNTTSQTQRAKLNFIGSTNVADNSGNTSTDIHLPGAVFSQTASGSGITNTTTATNLIGTGVGSVVFPANSLVAGEVLVWHGFVTISSVSGDILSFPISTSGASIPASGYTMPTLSGAHAEITIYMIVVTTGSSGSVITQTILNVPGNTFSLLAGSSTFNTTISQTLNLQAQWNVASTSDVITAAQLPFTLKVE